MRYLFLLLLLVGLPVHALGGSPDSLSDLDVKLSSREIPQGGLALIECRVPEGQTPMVKWMGQEIPLLYDSGDSAWSGFLGIDLNLKPGKYKAYLELAPSKLKKNIDINVQKKDYGVRKLTLPKKMVDLDAKTLKRVKKESGLMKKLWTPPFAHPLWKGGFIRPVKGKVVGPFGRRSIINEQPRSPHSGVDLRGAEGTPVLAINNGKVAFIGDHFFTGLTVVIEHGGGIQSMYFHLSNILVNKGQTIAKGETLGLVGSTGRSSGPHLHWGMRVSGARVDPLALTEVSNQLKK